jgi:putative ABC transport system substrate-binding protein
VSVFTRRGFLVGLSLLVGLSSASAAPPSRPVRIGWLSGRVGARPGSAPLKAFEEGLREGGFVVGQTALLDINTPEHERAGDYAALTARLIARAPDVILAANPSAIEAVARATTSIAIVGVDLESDPVAKGWVASLGRPGRNLTGFFLDIPEMRGKHLQLLQEVRPTLTRIAVLGDSRINELQFGAAEAMAAHAGVTLRKLAVTDPGDIPPAIGDSVRQGAGALVVLTSPLINNNLKRVAETALAHRLPAICGFVPSFAEAGGLLAYGPDFSDLFRRAAGQVVAILKGAAPHEQPIQRPTKFPLVINVTTAKALGVSVPHTLLVRADHVIE